MVAGVRISFSLRGVAGSIDVEVGINEKPSDWGVDLLFPGEDVSAATGYPVCTATVDYPVSGYGAVMGWVQLVRSDDGPLGSDVFAPDQTTLFGDLQTPYAWFGSEPTLFDAPFRGRGAVLDWVAHSFLCFTPRAVMDKVVHAVTGFSWGFRAREGEIRSLAPAILQSEAWDGHADTLRDSYPAWTFAEGFNNA